MVLYSAHERLRHSISKVAMCWGFSRTTIEYTVNIGNPVNHQISDIAAPWKKSRKNGTNDWKESFNVTKLQPFLKLLRITMLGHQKMSACKPFNETSSIWSRRSTCVPLLTAWHKALRLAWTCQHRHWIFDDWKHVAWSGESHFLLYRADERLRVWRQPHESIYPACQ